MKVFVFLPFVVFTLSSQIGLDKKMLVFFPNFSYPIFHFGSENSSFSLLSLIIWAQNWLKKSRAKSEWLISSAPLGKFTRAQARLTF